MLNATAGTFRLDKIQIRPSLSFNTVASSSVKFSSMKSLISGVEMNAIDLAETTRFNYISCETKQMTG